MAFNKLIWVVALLTLLIEECDSQLSVCGQPALNTRIVGGEEASPGSWPWMVSLHIVDHWYSYQRRCGGSLINDQWVLTAARCFYRYTRTRWHVTVYLGRQSQEGSNPNEVMRKVAQINIHYNYYDYNNNIALVKLKQPVSFTSYISPVCLAASDSIISTGVNTWITGWGDTGDEVPLPSPKSLMEAEVEVVENSQCNSSYGGNIITDNIMCAKSQDGGKGFCSEDYGGPLVSKQCGRWIQLGIANQYQGCNQTTLPGLYTNVSQYESWINSVISTTQPSFISFTSTDSCPPKLCGHAPLGSRIFNGSSVASAGEWPWMASLQKNNQHVCGGTLVSKNYVLTDASCLGSLNLEWKVKLGRLTQNGSNPFEALFDVVNITMSSQTGNNIAVLKLSPPPTLNDYIQPICLSNRRTFSVGTECWAAGWSSGRGGAEQPLHQFQATVLDCGNGSSTDIMCTELFTMEQGDYGGPLMCRENDTWFQTAVLSLGNNSSPAQPMMIFDKLNRFRPFLEDMSLLTREATDNSRSNSYSPFFLLGLLLLFALSI